MDCIYYTYDDDDNTDSRSLWHRTYVTKARPIICGIAVGFYYVVTCTDVITRGCAIGNV